MNKRLLLAAAASVSIFLFLLMIRGNDAASNNQSKPRYASVAEVKKTLAEAFPEDTSKYNFTHSAIILSMLMDPAAGYKESAFKIKVMADELRVRIADNADPDTVVEIINEYFFSYKGLGYNETAKRYFSGEDTKVTLEDIKDFYAINRLLDKGAGVCLSLSIMYIIMGENLHLPIYGAVLPGHIFVRYLEPGKSGVNIETTAKWAQYYQYDEAFNVSFNEADKKIYGDKLGSIKVMGLYAYHAGMIFDLAGKKKQAFLCYQKAAGINPDDAFTRYSLGKYYAENNDMEKAQTEIKAAVTLLPSNPELRLALAGIYLSEKHYLRAENECHEALRLKPGHKDAEKMLQEIRNKNK